MTWLRGAVGMGCMRLSTVADRDDDAAVAVLVAALTAGVTLFDTADAYALDDTDTGHNERLVARAIGEWGGDRDTLTVATKGGMTRPGGKWVPNGKAGHLAAACEASLRAMDGDSIDLYQLHVPDPRTKLSTSVRALRKLRDAGLVRRVGLCNVNQAQLDEALDICPIDAVQVALSPVDDEVIFSGLVSFCHDRGVAVLAHSPFGGPRKYKRLGKDKALARLGSPYEATLSWLYSLGVVPLPGATRVETARSCALAGVRAVNRSGFAAEDPRRTDSPTQPDVSAAHDLDTLWPAANVLRQPLARRRPPAEADGEVVLLMGIPGAGKSTAAAPYTARGYQRLNRDDAGGGLRDLQGPLRAALEAGQRRFVLDNTYATRASRARVREVAWSFGVPVRCVFVDTPAPEAQRNAIGRLIDTYGRLPEPSDLKTWSKSDPHAFGPNVQFRFERELEPPDLAEGFSAVERREFVRQGRSGVAGVFIQEDELPAVSKEQLDAWASGPVAVFGWTPGGDPDGTIDLHGHTLPVARCTHPAGPPVCWCRSPLPGLLELHTRRLGLDPAQCTMVSSKPPDRTLATRMGLHITCARQPER